MKARNLVLYTLKTTAEENIQVSKLPDKEYFNDS